MVEEENQPNKQLETARGGSGRKGKTAVGVGDHGSSGGPPPAGPSPAGEIDEPPEKFRPRTVVCERDDTIRKGLVLMLAPVAEVVGEAADGMAAYEMITKLRPDLVVIDVDLDILHGLEVLHRLQRDGLPVKSLVATDSYHATKFFHQLFRAGAGGIYRPSTGKKALRDSVRELMSGGRPLDENIAELIVQTPKVANLSDLTKSEMEILLRLDLRNKEIAQELNIELRKVEKNIESIFAKLKVWTRIAAALKAVQMGYTLLPRMLGRDPATGTSHEYLQALQHAKDEIARHESKDS
jgi:DNA-binding NarL/FixJ family response regulator